MWPVLFTTEIKYSIPQVATGIEAHLIKVSTGAGIFGAPRANCQVMRFLDDGSCFAVDEKAAASTGPSPKSCIRLEQLELPLRSADLGKCHCSVRS